MLGGGGLNMRQSEETHDFTNSPHCGCHAHCRACRTDPTWRLSAGAPDICPHGVTADDLPPVTEVLVSAGSPLAVERLAVCDACDDGDCGIKHQTNCRRRAILSRANFQCPRRRFESAGKQRQDNLNSERMLT